MDGGVHLGRRITTGATWLILQRFAIRIIGLLSTIILARLLVPADFGLVALATTLVTVLETLFELGFDLTLIQNQSADRKLYNTAWTLQVLRGAIAALILLAAAQPMALLYDEPRLFTIMLWLSLVAFANGIQNIGIVEFRKDIKFDREFYLFVGGKLAGFVTTVTLALIWRDYHALIAGIVAGRLGILTLTYVMHPYRPWFSLENGRSFLHFSKWLALNNVVAVLKSRLDTFIVGKISGTAAVGFYNVGFEISNLTSSELIWPVSRVLFPGFAKMSGDRARLAQSFVDSISVMVFLAVPLGVLVAIGAEQIVHLFLGPKWLTVIPLIQILTLYGLLSLPSANTTALYLALGRPDLVMWRNLPSVLILIPGLVISTRIYGITGAAWAVVVSAGAGLAVNLWLLRRELDIGLRAFGVATWRPMIASLAMGAALLYFQRYWPADEDTLHLFLHLAAIGIAGVTLYLGCVLGLWVAQGRPSGAEKYALALVKR